VALDVVGSPGNDSFCAIETLFEKCRGSLTLEPAPSPVGKRGLCLFRSPVLRVSEGCRASLRFARCGLVDHSYARFLEILAGNESLERFDLNLDATPDLRNVTQSLTGLLHRNRRLKTPKLSRVPREAAGAILERSFSGLQEYKSLQELHVTLAESKTFAAAAPPTRKRNRDRQREREGRAVALRKSCAGGGNPSACRSGWRCLPVASLLFILAIRSERDGALPFIALFLGACVCGSPGRAPGSTSS
jgi:hypothetical protein